MSRVAWIECASGASGDMLLGALVDLGLPLDRLEGELRRLGLPGWSLAASRVVRSGLTATKVDVVVDGHEHHHRGLHDILRMIDGSGIESAVQQRAASLFRRLADAEGAVHGVPADAVHFHEVGAIDSIVDIVGCVLGLHWLGAARVMASPLNVGSGRVSMAHGSFPVPAPATARLLGGVPVYADGEGELLTPTGALVVTSFASAYGVMPPLTVRGVGYGAGTRDTPGRPNVVRIVVGDEGVADETGTVLVLECELDDLSPQLCAPVLERLLAAGALDAYLTPVLMKKGRPGVLLTALVLPSQRNAAEEVVFRETTTLGVRWHEASRTVLDRSHVEVETAYGVVAVKVGGRDGRVYNAQPEFEDCRRLGESRGVPVKEVWAAALAAYRALPPARA